MENNYKYPRTLYVPSSPTVAKGDRVINDISPFINNEIVITEKLDGENTCLCQSGVYARSHTVETRSPWSINLWDQVNGFYNKIKDLISPDEYLYGENLYGIHSIEYPELENYWHLFAVRNSERWYSWDEVTEFSNLLLQNQHGFDGRTVPELWRGTVKTEKELNELILKYAQGPSKYGPIKEGVVIRLTKSFSVEDFNKYICKWVRPNHVQTDDKHWTTNWKPAKLKR